MGAFANIIYWTNLVIWCTNLMHKVLSYIHVVIPSYGLGIIVSDDYGARHDVSAQPQAGDDEPAHAAAGPGD